MTLHCKSCDGSGFHNMDQLDDAQIAAAESASDFHAYVLKTHCSDPDLDVCVCDRCGDGDSEWHETPGDRPQR